MSACRLILALTLSTVVIQPAPRYMTAKDTLSMVGVGAPAISPDDQFAL